VMASEANEPGSESGKRSDAPQEGGASSHLAARLPPRSPGSFAAADMTTRTASEARPAARGLPVVAIVGRPNVGKSTLFNRLVCAHRAIVDDAPGVTRDRVVAPAVHAGRAFLCVDTGGFAAEPPRDPAALAAQVRARTLAAVAEADCVVCVLDGPAGLAPEDRETVRLLRRSGKPVVYVVNKLDTPAREPLLHDFHALGIEPLLPVSVAHGRGVADLLDALAAALPEGAPEASEARGTRLALIGRPNVGKSSLLNRLLRAALVAAHPAFAELPLLCVSAVTGEALGDLFPLVARVERAYEAELPTPALNRALAAAVAATPPPSPGGKALRFFYAAQTGRRPPAVAVFASAPALVPAAYARYLVGRLTEAFRLTGVPLRLALRTRRTVGAPRARGRTARPRDRRPPRRGGASPRPR